MVCARELVREHGIRVGLYEGLGTTVAREIPQYVLYFLTYEKSKSVLTENTKITPLLASGLAGALAGMSVWLPPFYCVDVIKTRLQSAPAGTYDGVWDCVGKSYRKEGVGVFVRGAGVAQGRALVVHGSIFALYEWCLGGIRELRSRGVENEVRTGGEEDTITRR